jgi:DHA2 family multidrug resistance protein
LALWLVRVDRPNLAMFKRIDYAHFLSMALFLGGLEYVLEEGPRRQWFDDPAIAIAGRISLVAFALFLERSFRSGGPIVKLTPFRKPTFAFACTFNLVIGFGLYASTYLIPVFLGRVRGYTSLDIGTTVFVAGIAQILSTGIAASLSQRVDPRYVITAGLTLFAASLWWTSHLGPEWGFSALLAPQLLRGFAVMLCIVPSVGMALGGFDMAELRYASGLFNLMRNLGGAIGIAVVNTLLGDQARIHAARLGEGLGAADGAARDFAEGLTQYISTFTTDAAQALLMAQGEMARIAGRQALTLAFDEVFRLMAWMFLAALIMVPFCRPPPLPGASAPVDAH